MEGLNDTTFWKATRRKSQSPDIGPQPHSACIRPSMPPCDRARAAADQRWRPWSRGKVEARSTLVPHRFDLHVSWERRKPRTSRDRVLQGERFLGDSINLPAQCVCARDVERVESRRTRRGADEARARIQHRLRPCAAAGTGHTPIKYSCTLQVQLYCAGVWTDVPTYRECAIPHEPRVRSCGL